MQLNDNELDKLHDEDLHPDEFEQELRTFHFGIWPEITGLIAAGLIVWFLFTYSQGVYS